jgi:hypothetical protein
MGSWTVIVCDDNDHHEENSVDTDLKLLKEDSDDRKTELTHATDEAEEDTFMFTLEASKSLCLNYKPIGSFSIIFVADPPSPEHLSIEVFNPNGSRIYQTVNETYLDIQLNVSKELHYQVFKTCVSYGSAAKDVKNHVENVADIYLEFQMGYVAKLRHRLAILKTSFTEMEGYSQNEIKEMFATVRVMNRIQKLLWRIERLLESKVYQPKKQSETGQLERMLFQTHLRGVIQVTFLIGTVVLQILFIRALFDRDSVLKRLIFR